jgi:hypothetical protein
MSGGSMNYLSSRVESAEFREDTPLRRAFREHLLRVAKALHEIEWVDSGDSSPGRDEDAILACLGPHAELSQLVAEAKAARDALTDALDRAES